MSHTAAPEQCLVWGKYATLADASVLACKGETHVLITVVSEKGSEKDAPDFLPLTVDFKDKVASTGRMPINRYARREIFTKESEILSARAIDRSIRPLFRKDFRQKTQIICTVMSYDPLHDPVIVALNGVSACLNARACEFGWDLHGPIVATQIGMKKDVESGKPYFIVNPTPAALSSLEMSALVVTREDGRIIMLEVSQFFCL